MIIWGRSLVDHLGTWIIGFRKRLNSKAVIAPVIWPITVAIATPRTPIAGQPSRPKIIIGLRIIFKTAPKYRRLRQSLKTEWNILVMQQLMPFQTVWRRRYCQQCCRVTVQVKIASGEQPLYTAKKRECKKKFV